MAVTAHVDLCTNRSGSDNSTHQSRRHNPFLKDNQRKTAEWANSTTQENKKPTTQSNRTQKKHKKQQIKGWRPMEKVAETCKLHRRTVDGHKV